MYIFLEKRTTFLQYMYKILLLEEYFTITWIPSRSLGNCIFIESFMVFRHLFKASYTKGCQNDI